MTRFAAFFFEQANVLEAHAAIDRLAHVVDREQACCNRSQRFHFDARAATGFRSRSALDRVAFAVDLEIDTDAGQAKRVGKRDQFRGVLGALDCGDARHAQHVALGGAAGDYHGERASLHYDAAMRTRDAVRFVFGADIDHVRLAARVEMGEFFQSALNS